MIGTTMAAVELPPDGSSSSPVNSDDSSSVVPAVKRINQFSIYMAVDDCIV